MRETSAARLALRRARAGRTLDEAAGRVRSYWAGSLRRNAIRLAFAARDERAALAAAVTATGRAPRRAATGERRPGVRRTRRVGDSRDDGPGEPGEPPEGARA